MPGTTSRRGATRPLTTVAVTAISIALHGFVLTMVYVGGGLGGLSAPGTQRATAEEIARAAAQPLPSCEADEALASAARLVYCTLPAVGREGCARRALEDFAGGRVGCHRVDLPASVSLLAPDRVEEIEPEPLMDLIEPEVLEEIARAEAQPPPPPAPPSEAAPPKPPPPPSRPLDTQVAEITPPESEEAPEFARFLAEFDSRVEEQTVARGTTEEMVARPEPSPEVSEEVPRPESQGPLDEEAGSDPESEAASGDLAMRALGLPQTSREAQPERTPGLEGGSEAPASEQGILARKGSGETFEEAQEASDPRQGESGGGGGGRTLPNLRPSEEILDRALGGGSVDHLEDVAEGEVTALNAKQWKFASFFNRVKRQVAQNWSPARVMALRDPSGKVYGVKNRITYLKVVLEPGGRIRRIHVVRGSGIDVLDEEAVRAFRAAQPFPNPPEGLVEAGSQEISFLFGFHFNRVQQSSWRLFR